MALPALKRIFAGDSSPVGKLEENLSRWAAALTGQAGLLARGLTLRDNLKCAVVAVDSVTVPDPWQPLTLLNSVTAWGASSDGAPAVRWRDGSCELRGLLRHNSTGGVGDLASLPSDFLPPYNVADIPGSANWTPATLGIAASTGVISINGGASIPAGTHIGLHGVRFEAARKVPLNWTDGPLFNLPEGVTWEPATVALLSAQGADGVSASGLRIRWKSESIGQFPGVRVLYVDGLAPGAYSMTFLVLPE